ncbi:ATP-grasp domain-containing protein [Enterococcus mundtii]|uniref:ATP-grasp domain-containing protein n=1 Tax=Enterococcus TaxID=1350 RepID=UPI000D344BE9|nr:ATP-grasp domain-containing protein [Enterococcus mundtii]PTO35141.1 hypothetical protein C6P50_14515 [Enterococcus mundtii]STD24739.1 carbamoyl phosphate synthase-like protein [Enterococcus mundtii]
MNILILSCGTRNKIVEYFKRELLENGGKVYGTDSNFLAPALYMCDDYFIVPPFTSEVYLKEILKICQDNDIHAIFSLIDTEIEILSKNRRLFEDNNITVFAPSYDMAQMCLNKEMMYNQLLELGINTPKSYFNYDNFLFAYQKGEVSLPVFVKPICGSASIGVGLIHSIEHLEILFKTSETPLMIQENMNGKEYGIDCYIDIFTGEVIDIFVKEKLRMRAGETDKSKSIHIQQAKEIIEKFVANSPGLAGPNDFDLFEKDGEFYLSEVNPRFGGGYPHAYESGVNFTKYLIENSLGKRLEKQDIFYYKEDVYMMKYSEQILIEK